MAQDARFAMSAWPTRQIVTALVASVCASCVTAQSLNVRTLRAEIDRQQQTAPYEHDPAADLAWIRAMPMLQRLASDILNLEARFIAVDGEGWSVPGVPARLYCLIGPASMRPIPINAATDAAVAQALSAAETSFIEPYNRLLAEYYEAEYGWECPEEA